MSEEETKPSFIYTNESGAYDVTLLSDEAKQAFQLFNSVIQGGLTEEALIEAIVVDDDEDSETEED